MDSGKDISTFPGVAPVMSRNRFSVPLLEQAANNSTVPEKPTYGEMREVEWPQGENFVSAYTTTQKEATAAQKLFMNGATFGSGPNIVIPEQIKNQIRDGVFTDIINIAGNLQLPSKDGVLHLDTVTWAQAEIHKNILPEHFTAGGAATFLIEINNQPWGIVGTGVNFNDNRPVEYGIFAAGNLLTAKSGVGYKQEVA